jgi:hypothetical protein
VTERSATRRELEVAVRRLLGDTSSLTEDVTSTAKKVGPAAGLLAALLAYGWGRRRGRRQRATVTVARK